MNDLMTKSFLSYVDLKKQAQRDMKSELDIENGGRIIMNPVEEHNLSHFFQEVAAIESEMEEIVNLLLDLQKLNQETKSTHSPKVLRGLRDQIESNIFSVLRKAKIIKARLESLDKSNTANRRVSEVLRQGSSVDRTRVSVTNGLRVKLRNLMNDFQSLREKILLDYKEDLKRRYFNATGEQPSEEVIEKVVSGGGKVGIFDGEKGDIDFVKSNKERHDVVMDIQRSLTKLHQVFLDMAVIVETQGDALDNIQQNVVNAGGCISGGTRSLYYANQMKKRKNRTWVWILAVGIIILLVCLISLTTS